MSSKVGCESSLYKISNTGTILKMVHKLMANKLKFYLIRNKCLFSINRGVYEINKHSRTSMR